MPLSRRTVLKGLGASGAIPLLSATANAGADAPLRVAGRPVEVAITIIEGIIRISVIPLEDGASLLDLVSQTGPELITFQSSDFSGAPPELGNCIEVIAESVMLYPTWT